MNGHLLVVQWIYESIGVTNFQLQTAFDISCCNGQLEIAQWLHSLGKVNVHAKDDFAFRFSCGNGFLKVVNIHAENDDAFIQSKSKHPDVASWLQSLFDSEPEAVAA